MFCPKCGSKNVKVERWETCQYCGAIWKMLNTPEEIKRGY
jgi:hypothetical protein